MTKCIVLLLQERNTRNHCRRMFQRLEVPLQVSPLLLCLVSLPKNPLVLDFSRKTFQQISRIEFLQTFRAKRVTELDSCILSNIFLHSLPISIVIPDLFAMRANR